MSNMHVFHPAKHVSLVRPDEITACLFWVILFLAKWIFLFENDFSFYITHFLFSAFVHFLFPLKCIACLGFKRLYIRCARKHSEEFSELEHSRQLSTDTAFPMPRRAPRKKSTIT